MSQATVTGERAPDLDQIEYHCELVERECRQLLAWARERAAVELAAVQDATVELEEGWSGRAAAILSKHAYELRAIVRTLVRGQLGLVNPGDERYAAVSRQLAKQDEYERDDAPWRAAA